MSLPTADELFRRTAGPLRAAPAPAVAEPAVPEPGAPRAGAPGPSASDADDAGRTPSGRVRHDEKITVYVTADELLDLEHARLSLRRTRGLAVDRGRLVREAVAIALADFELNGDESVLVQRLTSP